MADLTLPGTIPGLLRRGSPVVVLTGRHAGAAGVVVRMLGGAAEVALELPGAEWILTYRLDEIAIDLTDATGRAHAAWWMAERRVPGCRPGEAAWYGTESTRLWSLYVAHRPFDFAPPDSKWSSEKVAALDGLLPGSDPRLLPDGSRWVDAEALRRVVLHVAGVSP